LKEVSGKDVGNIMSIWTKKVGYPIVTVTESAIGIRVQQNRFLSTSDVKPEEDETLFLIFLALKTKKGMQHDLILNTRSMT
jgi:aminopeptidase 2